MLAEQIDHGTKMQLWEHYIDERKELEMIIDGVFIMASYNHLSSELLIRNAMKQLGTAKDIDILIGGLGMGFTVREACSYPDVKEIDVVEMQPVVVNWNREILSECNGRCLQDDRVRVIVDDFYDYVSAHDKQYHIISMDIDNGPMMLVTASNERVYNLDFFKKIKEIMKPGGIFVIWSCNQDTGLLEQTRQVFDQCYEEEVIEEHNGRKISYFLYFARVGENFEL